MSDKLLQVEHLKQYFPAGGMGKNRKFVKAVDDVSFFVNKGETLGLVGEVRPPPDVLSYDYMSPPAARSHLTAR